jgi:hypothetical protein
VARADATIEFDFRGYGYGYRRVYRPAYAYYGGPVIMAAGITIGGITTGEVQREGNQFSSG